MGYCDCMNQVGSYEDIFDVVICGGGTSGCAAAIACARTGAKTLLIERTGSLGGQMSVSGPPGFAYARLFNPRGERDVGGIVEETHNRLYKCGHALPHLNYPFRLKAGYSFSYVDPDWWTSLMFEMMEEEDVTLLLDTLVVGVTKSGASVTGVIVENADGRHEIGAKVVVDCTGEAYVSLQAGAPCDSVSREQIQPHSLAFTVDGVDWDALMTYVRTHPDQISFRQLILPFDGANTEEEIKSIYRIAQSPVELGEMMGFYELRDIALKNGDWHPYSGVGFFIIPRENGHLQAHFQHSSQVDNALPTSAWDLSRCNIECRKQNNIAWGFIKNYIPGFKNAYISKVCTELRLREGPRIIGDYVLTRDDVAEARKFSDSIGRSSFKAGGYHVASVDTLNHVAATGSSISEKGNVIVEKNDLAYPKEGGSYDIPYRCLVPKEVDGLLAAGKCVSTDRPAYLRYLHQTMVTGQAAGVAAGLCVRESLTPRELESRYSLLQKALLAQGVIL